MSTVGKKIADEIIAGDGYYQGDHQRATRIVKYTNAWGVDDYAVEYTKHTRYAPSGFINNPTIVWSSIEKELS